MCSIAKKGDYGVEERERETTRLEYPLNMHRYSIVVPCSVCWQTRNDACIGCFLLFYSCRIAVPICMTQRYIIKSKTAMRYS